MAIGGSVTRTTGSARQAACGIMGVRIGGLGLVSVVGLAAVGVGVASAPTAPLPLAITAAGASLLCAVGVVVARQWLAGRQHRRDLAVVSALYGHAPPTALVENGAGRVIWANSAARDTLSDTSRATSFLEDVSADPAELVARLHDRALAEGRVTHDVALDTGDLRLTVRPAGEDRSLWQLDVASHPDPRDALPFDMVQTQPDGRISYLSPRLRDLSAPPARHVSDLLQLPLPAAGHTAPFTASVRHAVRRASHVGLKMPVTAFSCCHQPARRRPITTSRPCRCCRSRSGSSTRTGI